MWDWSIVMRKSLLRRLFFFERTLELLQQGDSGEFQVQEAEVWAQLGVAMQSTDRASEALQAYQQAVQLAPEHHACHANLAMLYGHQKDFKLASEHIGIALRLDPQNESYLAVLDDLEAQLHADD
mmetsp:Transcript_9526/g.24303  ORF Transcript_9526/g.24303 Transcript_9526/m.24303 type:complete len:125 (-) Transcript_9526:78-452(-)